jgi:hypothetical protein
MASLLNLLDIGGLVVVVRIKQPIVGEAPFLEAEHG